MNLDSIMRDPVEFSQPQCWKDCRERTQSDGTRCGDPQWSDGGRGGGVVQLRLDGTLHLDEHAAILAQGEPGADGATGDEVAPYAGGGGG